MLKNILNVSGAKELNKAQLKNTKGGVIGVGGIFCFREKDGVYVSNTTNQSPQTAGSWVVAWESLGWTANCFGIGEK